MPLLELIDTQPEFPKEDLTDNNTRYLSVALSKYARFSQAHEAAKLQYPLFTGTHKPLLDASGNLFDDPSFLYAVSHGIGGMEAIAILVGAENLTPDIDAIKHNVTGIINPANNAFVENYFEQAYTEFVEETPHTAEVISETVSSFYPGMARAAILGGAIARRFELDCTKDTSA